MTSINNEYLFEYDIPPIGQQPGPNAGIPAGVPGMPGDPMGQGDNIAPTDQINNPPEDIQQEPDDINNDPQYPDMPEEDEKEDDFEVWKMKFFKEAIKGDQNKLIDMINTVKNNDLDVSQRKFVKDNLQILILRMNSNINQSSNEIRRLVKNDLDRTNPASTLVNHITNVLDKSVPLTQVFIKLLGLTGSKGDLHRKYIGSLLGAIQVGNGGNNEDLVYEEDDYSIRISTRFNAKWGDVNIGKWALKEDDPKTFLKEPELRRLESGSPEEKDVLRRRIVMESISAQFKDRAFIINVVGTDGTIYHLGWDLGNCLKSAYVDGKLVVRTKTTDNSEAIIDDDGSILPTLDWKINFLKHSEETDSEGKSRTEEIEFIERRDGLLFLTAQLDTIQEVSTLMQGFTLKQTPFNGNPTDLLKLMDCVPSVAEMILRACI